MNTVVVAFILTLITLAGVPCETADTPAPGPGVQPQPDRVVVAANIDGVALVATGGAPVLELQVGLPNACYELSGYEVSVETGQPVSVNVYSTKIVGPYACAAIYLTEELRIPLESVGPLQPSDELDVILNGEPRRLRAESAAGAY